MKKIIILIGLVFITNIVFAITIDGYAFLENQTNHSGIEIYFEMIAPSDSIYTVYTNSNGYYVVDIENGIYDITYSKDDYFFEWQTNQSLFSNTTLPDITLLEHTTILNVPSVFSTIQTAIDHAFAADTVLVQPGTYYETIDYCGKNITVASLFLTTQDTSYISLTIIDADWPNNVGSVVTFHSGESTAVLSGFTIQNGRSNQGGGGIYSSNYSTPSIENVIIVSNSYIGPYPGGGGVYCWASNISLENVIISDNYSDGYGGGIFSYASDINLENVTIIDNYADGPGGGIYLIYDFINGSTFKNVIIANNTADSPGAGIYLSNTSPCMENMTITGNSGGYGYVGAGIHCYNSNPSIVNSIVSDNMDGFGICVSSGTPSITYSNFFNNENGNFYNCGQWMGVNVTTNANGDSCDVYMNIQLDPLFVDIGNKDYHLTSSSPCVDAGDPNSFPDPDGTIADMGAFYFDQFPYMLVADFNSDLTIGTVPLVVNFTDLSIPGLLGNPIIEWEWDFDNDGTIDSSEQNPLFTYTESGLYTVTLTVGDGSNTDTEIKVDYITVGETILADFEANPLSGLVPLEVQFTDLSTGGLPALIRNSKSYEQSKVLESTNSREIVSWEWDFDNDGTIDSSEQNPFFTYTEAGLYTVTLTVSDGSNTDTETKVDYITIAEPIIADFEANLLSGLQPLEVQFTDLSTGGLSTLMRNSNNYKQSRVLENTNSREIVSWQWDFDNDGTIDSNEQNPLFTYTEAGLFTVTLTVSDGTNEDTEIKVDYIEVAGTGTELEIIPLETKLYQNHPNPFNPVTNIKFDIIEKESGILTIFNVKGQILVSKKFSSGKHDYFWNAENCGSGIYFFKLKTDNYAFVKKMVLLK